VIESVHSPHGQGHFERAREHARVQGLHGRPELDVGNGEQRHGAEGAVEIVVVDVTGNAVALQEKREFGIRGGLAPKEMMNPITKAVKVGEKQDRAKVPLKIVMLTVLKEGNKS
jgi:hypothetical protein